MNNLLELKVMALEDDVHQRDIVEIIDRCIAAESKLAETEKHLKKWREDYENLVNSASESNVKFRDENISLKSKLAELYSQEPCGVITGVLGDCTFTVNWVDQVYSVGDKLYLRVTPAEAVQDNKYEIVFNEGYEKCKFKILGAVKSIGFDDVESLVEAYKNWLLSPYKLLDDIDANPKDSAAQRITEQDALSLSLSAFRHMSQYGGRTVDTWLEGEGRALLAKLNEHREPEASVDPLVRFNISAIGDSIILTESKSGEYCYAHQVTANKAEVPIQSVEPIYQAKSVGGLWLDVSEECWSSHHVRRIVYESKIAWSKNVIEVKRIGDQSVTLTFASCRSCSAFVNSLSPLKYGAQ